MIGFALCHGWSFDRFAMARLDEALARRFPSACRANFDLGFTGHEEAPDLPPSVDWIAVGHSYGFARLMRLPTPWKAAVSVNGFTRFCRRPGRASGTPARLVDAMLKRVAEAPSETVADFRRRCGAPEAHPAHLERERLAEHLALLRDLDIPLPACPVLALAAADDAIVSVGLAEDCFASPRCRLHVFPGDHMRLTTRPEEWIDLVAPLIEGIDG